MFSCRTHYSLYCAGKLEQYLLPRTACHQTSTGRAIFSLFLFIIQAFIHTSFWKKKKKKKEWPWALITLEAVAQVEKEEQCGQKPLRRGRGSAFGFVSLFLPSCFETGSLFFLPLCFTLLPGPQDFRPLSRL